MANSDPDSNRALKLLKQGLEAKAFEFCETQVLEVIQLCASGLMDGLRVQKVLGYSEQIYLMRFPNPKPVQGLVLRTVPIQETKRITRAMKESTFLQQSRPEVAGCLIPRYLGSFTSENQMIFVTELLPGTVMTEVCVGKKEALKIADAICSVQQTLSQTALGAEIIANAKSSTPYHGARIAKFLKRQFGWNIGLEELAFFNALDELRASSSVIVSDRSPANFVSDGENIGAFDFAIAFAGVAFEDWSWFIDDPRLNTSLSRQELLQVFSEDLAQTTNTDKATTISAFNLCSIFVCIKQHCLMLATGQEEMAKHYLDCASESAQQSKLKEAIELIRKLQAISPRGFPKQ